MEKRRDNFFNHYYYYHYLTSCVFGFMIMIGDLAVITQDILQCLYIVVVLHDADSRQHRVTQHRDVTHSARHQDQARGHAL